MHAAAHDFDLLGEVHRFLASSRTAGLATVDEQGNPFAANVQYAHDDALQLYFVSSRDAQHSRNLEDNGKVALTVYAHDDRAPNIHGVQLRGIGHVVRDEAEYNRAFDLYTAKFTFAAAMPQFREIIERENFYRITPTWLRWIDNRRGFGFKAEQDLPPNQPRDITAP